MIGKAICFCIFSFCLFLVSFGMIYSSDAKDETKHKIFVIQHQKFKPFDEVRDSFIYYLNQFNVNYTIDCFNADSNIPLLEKKIEEISKSNDIDLILSIGTHSTKRLVKKVKDIPIIFTIVGDPVNAGIVSDWESSGANYTGVETPEYYASVARLAYKFVKFKKLGMIYLKGSPSHEAGIKQIKRLSKELKFSMQYDGFVLRDSNGRPYPIEVIRTNIKRSLDKVCPGVDVFFIQTSKTFTENSDLFHKFFVKYKVLGIGDMDYLAIMIRKDSFRFGRQCAMYACSILNGKDPKDLPMDIGRKLTVDINIAAFQQIGIGVPFNLISGADNVYNMRVE